MVNALTYMRYSQHTVEKYLIYGIREQNTQKDKRLSFVIHKVLFPNVNKQKIYIHVFLSSCITCDESNTI